MQSVTEAMNDHKDMKFISIQLKNKILEIISLKNLNITIKK